MEYWNLNCVCSLSLFYFLKSRVDWYFEDMHEYQLEYVCFSFNILPIVNEWIFVFVGKTVVYCIFSFYSRLAGLGWHINLSINNKYIRTINLTVCDCLEVERVLIEVEDKIWIIDLVFFDLQICRWWYYLFWVLCFLFW